MTTTYNAIRNCPLELSFFADKNYEDPFNELQVDAAFNLNGAQWRVPAYWAGGNEWRIRFAPPKTGEYIFSFMYSDSDNRNIHKPEGKLIVVEYDGENPLFKHGPLCISSDRQCFEHMDGTPFLWLGDTWWTALTKRLTWPDDFQMLVADRVRKGFSVIQLVGGLFPDMPPFDQRGANEAGLAWEKDYDRIRPSFYDMADLRIQWLVRCGLTPCIFACWSHYLLWLGLEKMKRYWRSLVARWGAYPVVWSLAGEAALPYSLSSEPQTDRQKQMAGWAHVGRYLREIDPYHRPITIHPSHVGRDEIADESVLDFNMLQTGHGGYGTIPNHMDTVIKQVRRTPLMPVVVGETSYEGMILGTSDEIQRLSFWGSILSGAAGFTYGADGIWQANRENDLFGASPQGSTWGNTLWRKAMDFPGSTHLGLAKQLLERIKWWKISPHQEWVTPAAGPDDYFGPYAAGIPCEIRLVYLFYPIYPGVKIKICHIEEDVNYKASWWNPRTGKEHSLGNVIPEPDRTWLLPLQPELKDWLLIMRNGASA